MPSWRDYSRPRLGALSGSKHGRPIDVVLTANIMSVGFDTQAGRSRSMNSQPLQATTRLNNGVAVIVLTGDIDG